MAHLNKDHIPSSYGGVPPVQNFAAPSHHLSAEQSADIVALAESAHQDTQGTTRSFGSASSGQYGNSSSSGAGAGGFGSSATEGIANTLGGGTGSATRSHGVSGGEYERSGNDLTGNRTGLTSGAGLGSSSSNYDNTSSSSGSHSGLGAGAAGLGAGAAGAGVYGSNIGSHGDSSERGGASAVARKQEGRGGELTDHEFRNTAPEGTLENKLQSELERNARKAGTHASGFGVQGTPAGSASLGSGTSGLTGNSSSAGYGTSGQQYGNQSTLGGHSSSAAPAGAAGLGAVAVGTGAYGASGVSGQQGYASGQQGYSSADPNAPGSGGHLADQLHGLGTERDLRQDVETRPFGVMQDHKRQNNEF